jgi:hypothetical protein
MFPTALRTALPAGLPAATPAAAALLLRGGLIAGCATAIGIAAWMGDPGACLQADPALGRLLRGMAMIKGLMALAAVSVVLWRFGWRVSRGAATTYLIACWALAAATTLIWQLSYILPAALLFHVAAISMLWAGWRER